MADLIDTRRALHGVAQLLLAGPQYRESKTIRLAVTETGFRTVARPDIRLDGSALVVGDRRVALHGTVTDVADAVGITAAGPFDVYAEGPDSDPLGSAEIDDEARLVIVDAFNRGVAALTVFAPDETPVLWPEHFDVSIAIDDVTYGVSSGDDEIAVPYAYVSVPGPPTGTFWNASFGVARPLADLAGDDAVVAFFQAGRAAAAG